MTVSSITNVAMSAAGGFMVGTIAQCGLYSSFTQRTAGLAYPYFPYVGLLFGVTAAVARAVDQIFKMMGWTDSGTRLLTAHVIVGIAITIPLSLYVKPPAGLGTLLGVMFTISSLAINVLVK